MIPKKNDVDKENAPQWSPHTDTLTFLPLGIFNLMMQITKLDLVFKCTQCEKNENMLENIRADTHDGNREEVSQWELSLKKKIRDCELCNSITTGADIETVRGHLQSLKRREFEPTARRQIIEASPNSVLPASSTLFPPPPFDEKKCVDRQKMYSVRVYPNIRTPSPPHIDVINNQSKEKKGLNLSYDIHSLN